MDNFFFFFFFFFTFFFFLIIILEKYEKEPQTLHYKPKSSGYYDKELTDEEESDKARAIGEQFKFLSEAVWPAVEEKLFETTPPKMKLSMLKKEQSTISQVLV